MRYQIGVGTLLLTSISLFGCKHLDGIVDSAQDAAAQRASDEATGFISGKGRTNNNGRNGSGGALSTSGGDKFTAGNDSLFRASMDKESVGSPSRLWKTNGSGSVVSLEGLSGNWLELSDRSNYKLNKPPLNLPNKYTVEFDVVFVAEEVSELTAFDFGFDRHNKVKAHPDNADHINNVHLFLSNGYGGRVSSSETSAGGPLPRSLSYVEYANRPIHVSIKVEGNNMKVWLDDRKITDSQLFNDNKARYFYMYARMGKSKDATIAVKNFRMDGFSG